MAGNGGARPGAGRPKGTVGSNTKKAQGIRDYILTRIEDEKGDLINALVDKAKSGDTQAFKELMDRGMGKAQQAIDITTDGDKIESNASVDIDALAIAMSEQIKKART